MPTIEQNLQYWESWSWDRGGEEWSAPWGSTAAVWQNSIQPRIGAWLPCEHLLEIAVGYGRISQFFLDHCEQFTGVDLAPRCVNACRERFASETNARFHETDGESLTAIDSGSVDFAFSWDALVHCDEVSMRGYIRELARVLRPGGIAFLHHSNLGAFLSADGEPTIANEHHRDYSVSAETVREWGQESGLTCTAQEIVAYPGDALTDCFSTMLNGSAPAAAVSIENRDFVREAHGT